MEKSVFTVGHSTHSIEYFVSLLERHGVNCLIDIRSVPHSRIAPQFNKDLLSATLKTKEILYAHFNNEFGARRVQPSLLDEDGRVDFDKVRASSEFKQGIQRLEKAIDRGYKVALMCSEANPFDCHRFSMVSYELVREGIRVQHILRDGHLVENQEVEEWMLRKYFRRLPQTTLFETVSRNMQIELAYRLRGKDIAYSAKMPVPENASQTT